MKRFLSVFSVFLFLVSVPFILNAQWARIYTGTTPRVAKSIQQTTDGGYIVGGYYWSASTESTDMWILKLDAGGFIEWGRSYGGSSHDIVNSIQQTGDGGYIVAGYTGSFGAGSTDIWILKLDAGGFIEWERTYGAADSDNVYSIQQTIDGGYIVAGDSRSFRGGLLLDFWILKLDSGGNIEWQKTYGGINFQRASSIQQTTDGGYIVAGSTNSFGAGMMDFWILKLTPAGNTEWRKTYGGVDYDYAYSIQQTIDGGYIVAGETNSFGAGGADFWVLKLSSAGDIQWQKTYGGSDRDLVYSIQQTTDGGYIVVGITNSFGAGVEDIWILKLSSAGDIQWQKTYGGSNQETTCSIQQTTDGGYIVGGRTRSFGTDIWVLKLFPDGDIHSSCGFIGTSDATITDTSVSPEGTYAALYDTDIVPLDIFISPESAGAVVNLLCECPQYDLIISATSGGTTDPVPDTYVYYEGEEVTITAIADEGYRFTGWTGDIPLGHEQDNPITIAMDSDKSVTANFIQQYGLLIATTSGGTTDPVPGPYTYDAGTQISITAIPDTGYRFTGWSGDASGTDNPITITLDADKSITANFVRQYSLSIIVGIGGTTDPIPASYIYDIGTQVVVKAIPDANYRFSQWSGDASGTDNPITITMDSDKSIIANFIHQYKLTISAGSGGTTDPVPGTYTHDSGTSVSVKATPNSGYEFGGWSGDASGTANPISITMDKDKSITASFTKIPEHEPPEEKKGKCFIATAAYGSPLDPHVQVLREFRDKHLLTNKPGRALVKLYYKVSPPVARIIAKSSFLRAIVRERLYPIVAFAYRSLT